MSLIEEFLTTVRSTPFVLKDEKAVQTAVATLLDAKGIPYKREVRLSDGDIVDFMLPGGIAVEIKIKAQKREVFRQCRRYCKHSQVTALILMTATTMGLPPEIEGKPTYYVSFGKGWL
jgi:hypothetical protein